MNEDNEVISNTKGYATSSNITLIDKPTSFTITSANFKAPKDEITYEFKVRNDSNVNVEIDTDKIIGDVRFTTENSDKTYLNLIESNFKTSLKYNEGTKDIVKKGDVIPLESEKTMLLTLSIDDFDYNGSIEDTISISLDITMDYKQAEKNITPVEPQVDPCCDRFKEEN